jgi:hypothetical protein
MDKDFRFTRVWIDGIHLLEQARLASGSHRSIRLRCPFMTPPLHKMEREDFFTPDGFLRTGDMGRSRARASISQVDAAT